MALATAAYVRGSAIKFGAICTDATGNSFSPEKAILTLSFVSTEGTRRRVDMPCSVSGALVAVTWDSSAASDSMPVHWHIRASAGADKVAQDGVFRLVAAEANPTYP